MDITSILAYAKDLIATILTLLMMLSPAIGNNGAVYIAEKPDELVMSFAAVSDCHIETNNPESFNAFRDLLEGVKGGQDIDATVFLGDNVMNGQLMENLFFYTGVRGVKPAENNFVMMGNHDIGNGEGNFDELKNNFIANNKLYLGNDVGEGYYYRVVNGCYMIFLASEDLTVNTCKMTEAQLSWLKDVLDKADSEGAPILVFNHHPLYSLEGVEYDALAKLLGEYDEVVYFYGHTHLQLTADRFNVEGGIPTIGLSRSTEVVDYEPGDGIVVEVYEDEIVVKGRNFITGEWLEGLEYRY